jgi:DNA-binding response OmpR family regulator
MSARDFNSRILIVDDNVGDAFLLEVSLRHAGARGGIQLASNFEEAARWLDSVEQPSNEDPLVVIINTHGRDVEALKVVPWLRERAAFRGVFAAVLADTESEASMQHAFRLGANIHIVKPTSIPELSAVLWCAQTASIRESEEGASQHSEPHYAFDYSSITALAGAH